MSAFILQMPGKFPKEHRLHSKQGESLKTTSVIVKLGDVKVGVVNTVGMIYIRIINAVGLFLETGHALKRDGVRYEQYTVNKAMNHLCC